MSYSNLNLSELTLLLNGPFKDSYKGNLILFKGRNNTPVLKNFYFVSPSNFKRESKTVKEHGNVYNLLLNNLPSWQDLPLREKSIIVSSNLETAKAFAGIQQNNVYVVLLKPNSTIVVAPKSDIWYCFRKGLLSLGLRGNYDLVSLNTFFKEIAKASNLPYNFDSSWSIFKKNMEQLVSQNVVPSVPLTDEASRLLKVLCEKREYLFEFLDDNFNPEINGFVVKKYSGSLEAKSHLNNEIWTDSDSILIRYSIYVNMTQFKTH